MNSILEGRPALKREIDKVAEVAGFLWQKGWAERNGGNIVINVSEYVDDEMRALPALGPVRHIGLTLPNVAGKWFYCKGTNCRMRDLANAPMENGSIVRVLPDGESYEIVADSYIVPTSELNSHLAIHDMLIQTGCSYRASVHTHPVELVAMSHSSEFHNTEHLTRTLWSMIPETLAFAPRGLAFVPYGMPSSHALAEATVQQMRDFDVVMWEKHGTVAVGVDAIEAFDQTDVLNKAATIYLRARSMGFIPEGMTDAQMDEILNIFDLRGPRK